MFVSRVVSVSTRAATPAGARAMSTKANIDDLMNKVDVRGKRVLVRADLNVPLDKKDKKKISDDTRARAVVPTVKALLERGAKVVLCSHLGRPDGKVVESARLTPVAERLAALLDQPVPLTSDCVGPEVEAAVSKLGNSQVLLLENLRFHAEEEENAPEFSRKLASLADIYVNDAFGTAHRAHSSTEGVAHFVPHAVSGYLLDKELRFLTGAVDTPARPFAAIVGGAKVSTKLPVLSSLLGKVDKLLLGGAMIFTFAAAQGKATGSSLVEREQISEAQRVMDAAAAKGVQLLLPTDVVIARSAEAGAESRVVPMGAIPDGWMGLDIGPQSIAQLRAAIAGCRTALWNGPMGVFEIPAYAQGTLAVAAALAEESDKGCTTIIGGGDSVSAVEKSGLAPRMSHISTGGGASLELLEGKVLPGVAALNEKSKYI